MNTDFRVYLRALELDDYKTSIKWRSDDEIWNMVVGPKYFVSEAYEKKWVEDAIFNKANGLVLSICLKESDQHIGYVYLHNIDWQNKSAGFAKMIGAKEFWGKGIAQEAILLMIYHAFIVLGLERLEAKQLIINKGSIKANEKCGFKTEGVMRKAVYKNGSYQDLNLMSIIREDFDEVMKNFKWD
jgi:RimJ/RimL family protein N-acetyltransferase